MSAEPVNADNVMARIDRLPIAVDLLPGGAPLAFAEQGIYTVQWNGPEQIQLDFDLLTTDRRTGETHAELSVMLTDSLNLGRELHRARVNLLSTSARTSLAKYLASRDPARHDWPTLLEDAMQRVLLLYRAGEPAIGLRDAPQPASGGAPLLAPLLAGDGATILFGDGGTGKSYLALAVAATLQTGRALIDGLTPSDMRRVGYLDWEWSAAVHRRRLAQLWPDDELPDLVYVPCRLPLKDERDRLRRIIREHRLEYLILDSVALAAGGEPESAEVAVAFFGALRALGLDALCVAHVTNAAARGSADRPFGSAFWHNSARSTWYAKRQEEPPPGLLTVGLYNRKTNDGPLAPPLGIEIAFGSDQTAMRRTDVRNEPSLADELPVRSRMRHELRRGALPLHELADRIGASLEAVKKAAQRGEGRDFVKHPGPDGIYRIGLLEVES
jgi:hypothetical protein